MTWTTAPGTAPLYAAIARWVDTSLRADLGGFSDRPVWAPEALADLHRRLVASYTRGDPFDEQWRRRLDDAPDITLQLAGELLWVHLVFPTDTGGARKRELINATLARATQPIEVPADLDGVLDQGVAGTGVAYRARRQSQLRFLLEAVIDLKRRGREERDLLLADPWSCKSWLGSLSHGGGQSQREALLHLLHPATFEPIVSVSNKRLIAATFSEHVPAYVNDVDESLSHIRGALERHHGRGFRFIDPEIAAQWRHIDD